VDHLIKCAARALTDDQEALAREDVLLLTKRMRCARFLNGGTFGAVFEQHQRKGGSPDERSAVKFFAARPSPRPPLPRDPAHEFKMQKRFARIGVAWRPLRMKLFQLRGASGEAGEGRCEIGAIVMPFVHDTLDRVLQRESNRWSASELEERGARLASLLQAALGKGLVHNDAKCNNIGITPTGEPRLIDFGRSFDDKTLRGLGYTAGHTKKVLDLGTALDAWKLQDSVRRWSDRASPPCGLGQPAGSDVRRRSALLEPLQELCLLLLRKQKVLATGTVVSTTWWSDKDTCKTLKEALNFELQHL